MVQYEIENLFKEYEMKKKKMIIIIYSIKISLLVIMHFIPALQQVVIFNLGKMLLFWK